MLCYALMSREKRGKGVLTEKDKQYLRGEIELTGAQERIQRQRMRERIRNGIIDFALLFAHLDERDRKQILFDKEGSSAGFNLQGDKRRAPSELEWDLIEPDIEAPPIFTGGLRHLHAFAYLCMLDFLELYGDSDNVETVYRNSDDVKGIYEEWVFHPDQIIEQLVEEGIKDAFGKHDVIVETNVSIETGGRLIESGDLDDLLSQFHEGTRLTEEEVEWLIQTRRISFEEMVGWVKDSDWRAPNESTGEESEDEDEFDPSIQ